MAYRYQRLRLVIPSLCQANAVVTGNDWCGRTSASMIYNYYHLVRTEQTLDAGRDELVINLDEYPHNLVFRDSEPKPLGPWRTIGGYKIAADKYWLLATMQEGGVKDWNPAEKGALRLLYHRDERDGDIPSEREVQARFAPVIRSLEAFNPVLFFSGLTGYRNHIVVISGYELRRGELWLHIDDPGQTWVEGKTFGITAALSKSGAAASIGAKKVIEQEPADSGVNPDKPGIRYWLRARVLFAPNTNTDDIADDLWGDHGDPNVDPDASNRWGLGVYYSFVETPRRPSLVRAVPFASYPVALPDRSEATLAKLWTNTAESGAPYPIDTKRVWSNGVRIPKIGSDEVIVIAPGQVVAVRRGGDESPSRATVIVRHAFDEREQNFVPFPPDGLGDEQKLVFSLYGRLAPDPVSNLADPGEPIELERWLQPGHGMTMLGTDEDGAVVEIPTASPPGAFPRAEPGKYPEDELFPVEDYFAVPVPEERRNLAQWEDRGDDQAEVLVRVERGESALVGVFLDDRGWVLDEDVIRVEEGRTEPLLLHPFVYGAGTQRGFKEAAKYVQEVDATPDLALKPVTVFTSYSKQRALVEIRYGTKELVDNGVAAAGYQLRKAMQEALAGQEPDALVSLDALEEEVRASLADVHRIDEVDPAIASTWRDVAGTVIGRMGKTTTAGADGVHVEVFSEHYIIPSANAARWPKVEEVTGEHPGTQPYFAAQQEAITVKDSLTAGTQHGSATTQSTRTPSEWAEYCKKHHRTLSRLVAFHGSQWMTDWNAIAEEADPAHGMRVRVDAMPEAERAPDVFPELGIDGLDDRSYYFYHPLRLVEWLTTGIDVTVTDLPASASVSCVLTLGDEPFTLAQPYDGEATYRLRLVLGDPAGGEQRRKGQPAVLELNGIAASGENHKIPVSLKRGVVGMYAFTDPGGSLELAHQDVGYQLPEALTGLRSAYDGEVYLLADGNEALTESGTSTATVSASARYNLSVPEVAGVTLSGSGFSLGDVTVHGAEASGPSSEMKLSQSGDPVVYPTHARDVDVSAQVTPGRDVGAEATVTVSFSGGDLAEAFEGSITVKTREIEIEYEGEDVAKLQVYLSRIRAGDLPCYADLSGEEPTRRTVDGSFGPYTAQALWRFILFFASYKDWPEALDSVRTTNGDVELDRAWRTGSALEEKVAELLAAEAYPIVDAAVIDQLIERHASPWVPPILVFDDPEPVHCCEKTPPEPAKYKNWSQAMQTSVLPLTTASAEFHIPVFVKELQGGDLAALPIEVVLADDHAYCLPGIPPQNAEELLLDGITIEASGVEVEGTTTLLVYAYGRETVLLSWELGGAPNLLASTPNGYALASFQHLLARKGFYTGAIDGDSGELTATAIKDARAEYEIEEDSQYQALLQHLFLDEPTE